MFLCQLKARRQIGIKLRTVASAKTFGSLFSLEQFPHGDTLADLCEKVDVKQVSGLSSRMIKNLIRKKVLNEHRLFGKYYMVAIDGTGTFRFKNRHCDYCLTRVHANGETDYFHNVLEAKLITENGFAFSVMSEFIENGPTENPSKQDCELRAFYRLAKRLKKSFKRLPLCLIMDALFANGVVFDIARENSWTFLITLQDGSLRTINDEYERLKDLQPENRLKRRIGKEKQTLQNYAWINDIAFTDSKQKTHYVNVLECREVKPGKNQEIIKTKFKLVTNFYAENVNVVQLSNGGRARWKIENEGFNVQKNGGYGLKHAYSEDPNGFKVFYLLMQIAHTIAQLIAHGNLLKKIFPKGFGSAANLAFALLEAVRNSSITPIQIALINSTKIQIRFDSS